MALYTYITGRERRDIQNIFLKDIGVSKNGEIESDGFSGATITEANDFILKTLLVSLDGSKENVFDRVLDLHADEYEFIKNEVDKISKDWSAKKN